MKHFDLLLTGNVVVTATGESGESAAIGYVADHPGVTVVAWRAHPKPHGISILGRGTIVD